MKTKLFLFAALLISTITFSQTSKKGYDYYKASSDNKMNKAELTDAMAKDAGNSKNKSTKIENAENQSAKMQSNPYFVDSVLQGEMMLNSGNNGSSVETLRKRPGRSQGDPVPGIGITTEQGRTNGQNNRGNAQDHNASRSNTTSSKIDSNNPNIDQEFGQTKDIHIRKRPGGMKKTNSKTGNNIINPEDTKATDYNSSRSNRTTNN